MVDEKKKIRVRYVDQLPALITAEDYATASEVKKVRVQIRVTEEGLEILSDSPYPLLLDELLAQAGLTEAELMLCG